MRWQDRVAVAFVAAMMGTAATPVQAQGVGMALAKADQVVAIRAAQMFDARSGALVSNQVVLIKGDRVTDVGANLQIPAGARVIDLGSATMMPGMIDAHVHVNTGGNAANLAARGLHGLGNAQIAPDPRFTNPPDKDSRRTLATAA